MVSSIAYLLGKNDRVTGFGARRKPTSSCGRGYVRKVVGAVSRPALTYIANKIADVISGTGRKRRAVRKPRTAHSAGSFRPSGYGMRRKPRKTRKPRATLARVRRLVF